MTTARHHTLSSEQWTQVRELFDKCADLPRAEQIEVLKRETKGKAWLRQEVESLLERTDDAEALEEPLLPKVSADKKLTLVQGPQRLGKYLLLRPLGRGGMAEVFLAKATGPGNFERVVAVKKILREYADDPKFRAGFETEAKLCSQLSHANIVHLYDFGSFGGEYLLAMEFVHGMNLEQASAKLGALPPEAAIHLVAAVAEGLAYAHGRFGIIHRDISPKNIMVSFEGEIKIVDFGIAKADSGQTRTGNIRGTVGYLSPEVVAGKPADHRADLFSLSAVLYELLAGTPLFAGELFAVLAQIREGAGIEEKIRALPVKTSLKKALRKGLATDPDERFSSATEFREALGETSFGAEDLAELMKEKFPEEIAVQRRLVDEVVALKQTTPISRWRVSKKWAAVTTALTLTVIAGHLSLRPDSVPPPAEVTTPNQAEAATRTWLQTGRTVCKEEAAKFCPGRTLGTGLVFCLRKAAGPLSEECKAFVAQEPPKKRRRRNE